MNHIDRIARTISEDVNDADEGIAPHDDAERQRYAHADLITLPPGITGTNCGNCKYAKKSADVDSGFVCVHPDLVDIEISPRMCCSYWDNEAVERSWAEPLAS